MAHGLPALHVGGSGQVHVHLNAPKDPYGFAADTRLIRRAPAHVATERSRCEPATARVRVCHGSAIFLPWLCHCAFVWLGGFFSLIRI